jgi:hypothetical protein
MKKKRAYLEHKNEAIELRRAGKTYTEIQGIIEPKIPQSTIGAKGASIRQDLYNSGTQIQK